jgi:hypothetical protein
VEGKATNVNTVITVCEYVVYSDNHRWAISFSPFCLISLFENENFHLFFRQQTEK